MKYQRFILLLFMFAFSIGPAFARKPAVEDFMGVEPEGYQRTPQGTEVLYDFGNKIKVYDEKQTPAWLSVAIFSLFMILPFAVWFGMMKKIDSSKSTTKDNTVNNVTQLADYKNQNQDDDDHDDFKKVS